jgi:hypothetical protein
LLGFFDVFNTGEVIRNEKSRAIFTKYPEKPLNILYTRERQEICRILQAVLTHLDKFPAKPPDEKL